MRWAGDPGGEFLEPGVDGAAAVAVAVGGVDRGDLVLVLAHVAAEGGNYFAGAFGDVDTARFQQVVGVDLVVDDVVGAADLQQPGAQLGIRGERLDCGYDQGALGGAVTYGKSG